MCVYTKLTLRIKERIILPFPRRVFFQQGDMRFLSAAQAPIKYTPHFGRTNVIHWNKFQVLYNSGIRYLITPPTVQANTHGFTISFRRGKPHGWSPPDIDYTDENILLVVH